MDTDNHYLMGFQGADKVYILDDAKSEDFQQKLQLEMKNLEIDILKGFTAGHGPQGLGTFSGRDGRTRATVFMRRDLDSVTALSTYSRSSGARYEQLKKPLALLVCMISESARIPMMQRDFTNLYYGHNVVADEAIRSYDDAKYLITLSRKIFPEYPRYLAVEKLQKRAAELDSLVSEIQLTTNGADRIALITQMLTGKLPSGEKSALEKIKRFCYMCEELRIFDAAVVTQCISTCRSESAVRAAKQGVAVPAIALKTHAGAQ